MPSTKGASGKGSRSSSKKAKKGAAEGPYGAFTEQQIQEFQEGFRIMDADRDGVLTLHDIRHIFDEIGRISTDTDINEMLGEVEGPLNFTTFLKLFSEKLQGENDEDEVIDKAFRAYESIIDPGRIDSEEFRMSLMCLGEKFSAQEVDEAFEVMEIDDNGLIDLEDLISMITAKEN
ncbi:unnamed protein product [Meganyctiphanes norvegica]|uniref:EF-hand domain-containing protein n=1 Tax=Meganyctiphanes norvegica TaxID=48144 RepID=A0AAV2RGK3_MEGNR